MAESQEQFKLSSGAGKFASRSDDVFGSLDVIEKKHVAKERARDQFSRDRHKYMKDDPVLDDYSKASSSTSRRDNTSRSGWSKAAKDYEDKGSRRDHDRSERRHDFQFKAPRGRAPRGRFVPDYKKNPHKYTCYDLSDVTADQMSSGSNSAAAFDFLRQQQQLKAAENADPDDVEAGSKPVLFKKPKKMSQTLKNEPSEEDTSEKSDVSGSDKSITSYQSGKFKMTEYVVGQSSKKNKQKKPALPVAAADKVGLQHLFEDDESDEEESSSASSTFKNRNIRKRAHSSDEET